MDARAAGGGLRVSRGGGAVDVARAPEIPECRGAAFQRQRLASLGQRRFRAGLVRVYRLGGRRLHRQRGRRPGASLAARQLQRRRFLSHRRHGVRRHHARRPRLHLPEPHRAMPHGVCVRGGPWAAEGARGQPPDRRRRVGVPQRPRLPRPDPAESAPRRRGRGVVVRVPVVLRPRFAQLGASIRLSEHHRRAQPGVPRLLPERLGRFRADLAAPPVQQHLRAAGRAPRPDVCRRLEGHSRRRQPPLVNGRRPRLCRRFRGFAAQGGRCRREAGARAPTAAATPAAGPPRRWGR